MSKLTGEIALPRCLTRPAEETDSGGRKIAAIRATAHLRALRGGAQSQLCRAEDGQVYVVKSSSNPQGRRTLVNEWIAGGIYGHCGLTVPAMAPIQLNDGVLAELSLRAETGAAWHDGLHFGSRAPVDPEGQAIYDYLPERLLPSVVNLEHFVGALALDCWTGNVDVRQAIYFRAPEKQWIPESPAHASKRSMVVMMIDHGQCFHGVHWALWQRQPAQPYRGPVYAGVSSLASFAQWIERIEAVSASVLDRLRSSMPAEWERGDETAVDDLLEELLRRRAVLPRLIEQTRDRYPEAFPAWK